MIQNIHTQVNIKTLAWCLIEFSARCLSAMLVGKLRASLSTDKRKCLKQICTHTKLISEKNGNVKFSYISLTLKKIRKLGFFSLHNEYNCFSNLLMISVNEKNSYIYKCMYTYIHQFICHLMAQKNA